MFRKIRNIRNLGNVYIRDPHIVMSRTDAQNGLDFHFKSLSSQSESSSCSGRFRAAYHLLRNSRWRQENKECLYYRFFDSNLRKQAMFGTIYY